MTSSSSGPTEPGGPTATVIAASPCQPSTIAPQSIEIRSPALQDPVARDAVDHLVVDRRTDGRREPVVVQEVRRRAAGPDVVLGEGVELAGRHAGSDRVAHQGQRLAHDEARAAHDRDLLAGLDLESAVEHRSRWRWSTTPGRRRGRVEGGDDAWGDVLDPALGMDRDQEAEVVVEADQRGRVARVDLEPGAHGLRQVVVTLFERATAHVADTLDLRRVELDVGDVPAVAADPSAADPADGLVDVDLHLEYGVQRRAQLRRASPAAPRPAGRVRGKPSSRKPRDGVRVLAAGRARSRW